jgi:hypothetical protein
MRHYLISFSMQLHFSKQQHQLGFDADVLEIHLNELDWAVDTIFIMESTRTHNKVTSYLVLSDKTFTLPYPD